MNSPFVRLVRLFATAAAACLTACAWIPSATEAVAPGQVECGLSDIRINANNLLDAQDACIAAIAVSTFFRDLGLMKSAPITLSIVEAIPEELGGSKALGCFTPGSRHIRILSLAASTARGDWLGRPMDRALYKSLAAHELGHALAWCNSSDIFLSVRAREYVAYVVMFATMDPGHRSSILATASGSGFERDDQISDGYYYLAPYQFGVDAYRHYLLPGKGPNFFRAILRGEVLPVLDN